MPTSDMSAAQVVDLLGLVPLPHEGGRWAQTWLDGNGSGIYFLMTPDDFSAMHRLVSPELWHYYGGAPAEVTLLSQSSGLPVESSPAVRVLGMDLSAGQRPFLAVEPGVWMGAETTGAWTLVGTTMAPPYDDAGFELGDRQKLVSEFPDAVQRIERLTRPNPTGATA